MRQIKEIRKTLKSHKETLKDEYGLTEIGLFGSYLKGTQKESSDIDILVKLKPRSERPPLGLLKWVALEEELSEKLNREVDLVSEDGLSPYIRPYVDREKVILYEG